MFEIHAQGECRDCDEVLWSKLQPSDGINEPCRRCGAGRGVGCSVFCGLS